MAINTTTAAAANDPLAKADIDIAVLLCMSRSLLDRHRHARNLHLEGTEAGAGAKVDGLPIVSSEGEVGGVAEAVHDSAEFLAIRIEDVEAAGAAAKNISCRVDLHAVRHSGLRSAQVGKNPVSLTGERAVRLEIEGADVPALGV